MAQNTAARDAQDATDLDALEPGRVVEIQYDGSRGSRTVRGYVAAVETRDAILDRYETDYELRIGTPDDHTPRFLRLSFETTTDEEESGSYSFEENYEIVSSMNSKSDTGQRLGRVEAFTITEETDRRGVEVAQFRALSEGDRVRFGPKTATVLDASGHGVQVETDDGERDTAHYTATRGAFLSHIDDDYDKTVYAGEFEVLPERQDPTDDEKDLWERMTSYGHDYDEGAVEAVVVEGDRYEVVYRPTDSDPTMNLRTPEYNGDDARRNYDARLVLEPNGLRLSPAYGAAFDAWTLDPENVELVYEEDGDDEDDAKLVTDGGTDRTFDLPDYGNVEEWAENPEDLSDLSDSALDALDDRLGDMLDGDPYKFPSDEALSAAFTLDQKITEERTRRDPRTDDPHYAPFDTTERFEVPVYSVQVERRGDGVLARFTLNESDLPGDGDSSEWTVRSSSGFADVVLDYYDVDDVRLLGVAVGDTLPVVGADETTRSAWGRVDRYAMENDGTTALDEDDAKLVTDGGETPDPDDLPPSGRSRPTPRPASEFPALGQTATLQVRSATSGTRYVDDEERANRQGSYTPRKEVGFDRGAVVEEVPPTYLNGPGFVIVSLDPLVVDDGEQTFEARETDERGVLRVAYDDERLDSTEWDLPTFHYPTAVICPECDGDAWATFYTERREVGRPINTGSTGAVAPKYRTETFRVGEVRCNECETHTTLDAADLYRRNE